MKNTNWIKDFIEHNYGQFQEFLEDEHEIEGSEAESILDELEAAYKLKERQDAMDSIDPAADIDRKFRFIAVNPSNCKIFSQREGLVLLAKDNLVPATLEFYLSMVCRHKGYQSNEAKGVRLLIDRVEVWREAHMDQCKLPDITGERETRAVLGDGVPVMHHPV
jgi:hypothetical protein